MEYAKHVGMKQIKTKAYAQIVQHPLIVNKFFNYTAFYFFSKIFINFFLKMSLSHREIL